MDRSRFEDLVRDAIDGLPAEFASHLENVAVIVEDEPGPELLRSLGLDPRRDTLFGLYQGVPLDERGDNSSTGPPDTIRLYYRPLRRACRTPERLRLEIRKTLIHEVAHYFGMRDDEIERLGY